MLSYAEKVYNQKNMCERRPRRQAAVSGVQNSARSVTIEEAPVARAGPRSPDVFYRGEEARSGPENLPIK